MQQSNDTGISSKEVSHCTYVMTKYSHINNNTCVCCGGVLYYTEYLSDKRNTSMLTRQFTPGIGAI